MSKTYSSFEDQHMLFENWRRYTSEPQLLTEGQAQDLVSKIISFLEELENHPQLTQVMEALEQIPDDNPEQSLTGAQSVTPEQPLKRAAEGKEPQLVTEVALVGAGLPYLLEVLDKKVFRKIGRNPFFYENFPKLAKAALYIARGLLVVRKTGEAWYDGILDDPELKNAPVALLRTGKQGVKWLLTNPTKAGPKSTALHDMKRFFASKGADATLGTTASAIRAWAWAIDMGLRNLQLVLKKRSPDSFEEWLTEVAQIDNKLAAWLKNSSWFNETVLQLVAAALAQDYYEVADARGWYEKYGEAGILRPEDAKKLQRILQAVPQLPGPTDDEPEK